MTCFCSWLYLQTHKTQKANLTKPLFMKPKKVTHPVQGKRTVHHIPIHCTWGSICISLPTHVEICFKDMKTDFEDLLYFTSLWEEKATNVHMVSKQFAHSDLGFMIPTKIVFTSLWEENPACHLKMTTFSSANCTATGLVKVYSITVCFHKLKFTNLHVSAINLYIFLSWYPAKSSTAWQHRLLTKLGNAIFGSNFHKL